MAKNTKESAAECPLHCKIEDNDECFLEGKLAGQGLDLAHFSFVAAGAQDGACRPVFLGMLFQRLCQKRLPKGKISFSEIPHSNSSFVNHF